MNISDDSFKDLPSHSDALKNLALFVVDLSKDPNVSEAIQQKAAKVIADYLFAALMSMASKGNKD